uniref:Uncharacterized protein n=1 Tax=Onchocerca volvulus TaxID=6282 RepID=A0A8R1TLM5_ONCVO
MMSELNANGLEFIVMRITEKNIPTVMNILREIKVLCNRFALQFPFLKATCQFAIFATYKKISFC